MKKIKFTIAVSSISLILICQNIQAQTLYMPRNVKAAFEKGTRAMDGKPGVHYWQNHSNYDIDLTVAPPNRTIKGSEKITYFNDSPDTLKEIVFRLTMNYHKPDAGRSGGHGSDLDSSQLTSGIHIDHFEINGKVLEWPSSQGTFTYQSISLLKPLLPRDSIHFTIQWHYEIAPEFVKDGQAFTVREGMIDPTTWCVAYYYPRVAVYDDYNGWNELPFTGAQEFYNDFNNYILNVKVPANYIVWATGTLQNPDEVLQPHYAQLLEKSMTSDSVIQIATPADLEQKNITSQNTFNNWKWKADDITDMAIFVSDHDNWDAASVIVDAATGRRASVQAAYYDTSADFHHSVTLGQNALKWYSQNIPGVSYPYPKMSVVEGFAGMEYPMMVNDGSYRNNNINFTQTEEDHEIAHTYFPFYMGINESRYAFMDEGWATAFQYLIAVAEKNPVASEDGWFFSYLKWFTTTPSQENQVPIIESDFQTGQAYQGNAYIKPMWAYLALKDLLGDQLFKTCLHGYMDRWHSKHPIPWDFFNSFNNVSGKDLNWFWNSWFFSHGYNDIGVGGVNKVNEGYAITINNMGGFDIPFDIKINYDDGSKQEIHQTPAVWKKNEKQTVIHIKTKKKISTLVIDNGIRMDANEKDNVWKANDK